MPRFFFSFILSMFATFVAAQEPYFTLGINGELDYCGPDRICDPLPAGTDECPYPPEFCAILSKSLLSDPYLESTAVGLPLRPVVAMLTEAGTVHCSATIVGPTFAITAAHCLCPGNEPASRPASMAFGQNRTYILPILDLLPFETNFCATLPEQRAAMLDVGVFTFSPPAPLLSDFVAPVGTMSQIPSAPMVIAGYGFNNVSKTSGIIGYQVYGSFTNCGSIPTQYCNPLLEAFAAPSDRNSFFGGCGGDSGGPVIDLNGRLVAVIGNGIPTDDGRSTCGQGDTASVLNPNLVNSEDTTFADWINEFARTE